MTDAERAVVSKAREMGTPELSALLRKYEAARGLKFVRWTMFAFAAGLMLGFAAAHFHFWYTRWIVK